MPGPARGGSEAGLPRGRVGLTRCRM